MGWLPLTILPPTVTLNATGTETYQVGGASLTYSGITVAAGTNTVLLITLNRRGSVAGADAGIALTWDFGTSNQPMTLLVSQPSASTTGVSQIWGLRAPAVGNKTLHIAWTNAEGDNMVCGIAFNGVAQANDAAAFPNINSAFGVATIAVTSTSGNQVVGVFQGGAAFTGILGTSIYTDNVNGSFINGASDYVSSGASSVSVGSAVSVGPAGGIAGVDVQAG